MATEKQVHCIAYK